MAPACSNDGANSSEDEDIWNMLAGSAETAEETVHATSMTISDVERSHDESAPKHANALGHNADKPHGHGGNQPAPLSTATFASMDPQTTSPSKPSITSGTGTGTCFSRRRRTVHRIPAEILDNVELNEAIAATLPPAYDFEVHRTIWRLRRAHARHVGLQLPEGLQRWATTLADIFLHFVPSLETSTILADVTFGACCIDDLGSQAVGVDFLVHYGHSCIVPTDQTAVTILYIHVEIDIDVSHLVETVRLNFDPSKRIAFMGTVQFTTGVSQAIELLKKEFFADDGDSHIPQVKPLGLGETLGCTSPLVEGMDAVIFVCDGRFHLESAMIQNPHVRDGFFRYDPFARTLTQEGFAYDEMHAGRRAAIEAARHAKFVGLILGTLGRQGSSGVTEELERLLQERSVPYFIVLLSEITPDRLERMRSVEAWVQVACPRLSLDWGDAFAVPLLTPYEAHIAFGSHTYQDVYPMDYYSNKGGPWSNYGAHNGHGGSLGEKFRHLRRRSRLAVEYEEDRSTDNRP